MNELLLFVAVVLLNQALVATHSLHKGIKKYETDYTDQVETTSGPVVGTTVTLPTGKKVDTFLGIKYAQAKRFEKPQSPTPWTDPYFAESYGKACPQSPISSIVPMGIDEDCLFINVFVPKRKLSKGEYLPVMQWIHGGAYVSFSGYQLGTDILASEGEVIVVTFNYRLAALGFLATGNGDLPGNYGMFDQLKALQWTQDNIRSFGGDPAKVTLFGQSAGAFSTSLHVLSPLAAGLFDKAIAQSGPGVSISSYIPTDMALKVAGRFAEKIGCELATLKSCVNGKSVDEIMYAQAASAAITDYMYLDWSPVVDGDFLPDLPENLLKAGKYTAKEVMIGVNNDEGGLFMALIGGSLLDNGLNRNLFELVVRLLQWTRNQTKENVDSILFQYTNWNDPDDPISNRRNMMDVITDSMFAAPTVKTVQAYANNGLPTYFYQLQHGPRNNYFYGQMPEWMEAYHGADLSYVFGIPLLQDNATDQSSEVKFSKDLMKMWSDFAKTGNPTPSTNSPAYWPQYSSDTEEYLALKPDAFEINSHFREEYMAFWNDYISKQSCVVTSCENQADGVRFPYPGVCTKYYECQGSIAVEKKCPYFLLKRMYFSINTHTCTLPALSGCHNESYRRK